VLGKPLPQLSFDEAYFCYKGAVLVDGDKCRKEFRRLRDEPIRERAPIRLDRLIALNYSKNTHHHTHHRIHHHLPYRPCNRIFIFLDSVHLAHSSTPGWKNANCALLVIINLMQVETLA
ncbi:hypothetical protein GCK32_014554, partial [Trichostrongylus colubriformis]